MKTLLIVSSLVCLVSTQLWGQNYIGMSQSKIIKNYGVPDEKGANYITYQDRTEEGTNRYYFDNDNKCTSFVITRDVKYFEDYVKLLNREFKKSEGRKYVGKSKSGSYLAEIVESNREFEIRISTAGTALQSNNKTAAQGRNCNYQ